MIGTFVLDRGALLMSDSDDSIFDRTEKFSELNNIIRQIPSRTDCFKKEVGIHLQDGRRVYTFPEDLVSVSLIAVEVIDGELIMNTSYEDQVNSGSHFNSSSNSATLWGVSSSANARNTGATKIFFRDLVNANEFMIDPIITSGNIRPIKRSEFTFGSGVGSQDPGSYTPFQIGEKLELAYIPDAANEGDILIDTGDTVSPRALYVLKESYTSTASVLTVDAASRPGSVALVFTAAVSGAAGDFIKIQITNAGAMGTSTVVKTGVGSRVDPTLITFNMFDDDSSNDTIITLSAAHSEINVTGTDSTIGSTTPVGATSLVGNFGLWQPILIDLVYVAELPELVTESEEIHPSIPSNIRNLLPEFLASTMMRMDRGGDKDLAKDYESRWEIAISRAADNVNKSSAPSAVRLL